MHKNISYRPSDDSLRGVSGDAATANRMHEILKAAIPQMRLVS